MPPALFETLSQLTLHAPRAYLDPGSGSFILQILIAAFVGGAFVIKAYWRKITSFVARIFKRGGDNPPPGQDQ